MNVSFRELLMKLMLFNIYNKSKISIIILFFCLCTSTFRSKAQSIKGYWLTLDSGGCCLYIADKRKLCEVDGEVLKFKIRKSKLTVCRKQGLLFFNYNIKTKFIIESLTDTTLTLRFASDWQYVNRSFEIFPCYRMQFKRTNSDCRYYYRKEK